MCAICYFLNKAMKSLHLHRIVFSEAWIKTGFNIISVTDISVVKLKILAHVMSMSNLAVHVRQSFLERSVFCPGMQVS